MDVLDQNNEGGTQVSSTSVAIKWAIYGAIGCILVKLIDYLVFPIDYSSLETMAASGGGAKMALGFLSPIIFIVCVILAIKNHSEIEGRGFSFGRGLGTGVLTGLFIGIAIAIWTYIQFGVLDTGYQEVMTEVMSEAVEEGGDEAAGIMNAIGAMTSAPMLSLMAIFSNTFGGLIIGLIGAAIFKKD